MKAKLWGSAIRWAMSGMTAIALTGCATVPTASAPVQTLAYVGTQGSGPGQGVVAVRFDPQSGALTSLGVVAEVDRGTWVLADSAHRRLFTVSETGNDGTIHGAVLGFSYDPATGALAPRGRADSGGGGPTHLALSPDGRTLFVANYSSGHVATIPVAADGTLAAAPSSVEAHTGSGPNERRQKGPHAHGVTLDPSGRWLLSPDLGADKVYVYRFDAAKGTISPAPEPFAAVTPGAGPRHIVFSPDRRHAFLMEEMGGSIASFAWDAGQGRLTPLSTIQLDAADFAGTRSGSEIAISRDGRFLYAGNRAANRIQIYAVRQDGGLAPIDTVDSGGQIPWAFSLSGDGKWLVVANQGGAQGGGNLAVFAVDRASGRLTATGSGLELAKPTSISFTE
ncbi:6-phosphogluconolactonase (cycloisomerase 2 family) [Novosphingobium sp. PhB165]|uniref:lactonase family protein n=1 Tax=Novosphingobium sp. PhB165 TaxID=2485105 RepID=UPI0010D68CE3|nr:lactonase family protein [Novosphingobium sp. PhB165]TCM19668.1 6-phosphogluconolactonase (cycloisomerase 2 family) [Novosphingobium sp. PhB165]